MARSWYEKAEAAGDGQAPASLARLAAEDTKEAAALSGTNETSTISEESGRKITTRVSPGDETKNAPETIPTGPRMTYTVNGFPVTYIETTSTSSK